MPAVKNRLGTASKDQPNHLTHEPVMIAQPEDINNLVASHVRQADRNRRPDLLVLKYKAMRKSAFRFYRATPYLFYDAWVRNDQFPNHPMSWVCGDLHLENMGSYRADNRQVYFDINDFDEALLAPCTVDLARLVTSLFVAAEDWKLPMETARSLARHFTLVYKQTLLKGKPRSIERETASGVLKRFLNQVAERSNGALIDQYTKGHGRHRQLRTDGLRLLRLPDAEYELIWSWIETSLLIPTGAQLLDVVFRIAGTSSLGLARYVALIKTKVGKYKLLDLKEVRAGVAAPYWAALQPVWPDQATRVVTLQQRLQDVSPNGLRTLAGPMNESFVVRSLQPQADRINLMAKYVQKSDRLMGLLEAVAQLTASAHLRSGGQQHSAITDELIDFATQPAWDIVLLEQAETYAKQVQQDYQQFCLLSPKELVNSA